MAKLTALEVKKAVYPSGRKGPFMMGDGHGLYLQIMPTGSKSWAYRYTMQGRARVKGLGTYGEKQGEVSLSAARKAAGAARALQRDGIDPVEAKRAHAANIAAARSAEVAKGYTFEAAAQQYIETHLPEWKNSKHRQQWVSTLAHYAYPAFGTKAVGDVSVDDALAALRPVWSRAPETGRRVRGRIEKVLDFAKARGWRTGENPARWRGNIEHLLPNMLSSGQVTNHPALPWQQAAEFIKALEAKPGISGQALRFTILTAARSGEARGATWGEIDLVTAVWTIPAARMKGQREHRVPLNRAALAILDGLYEDGVGRDKFVFLRPDGAGPISDMAMSMLVRGMNESKSGAPPAWCDKYGRPIVPHGFRSTFRDWCEEKSGASHAVSEAALAHAVANKVEAAYRRTDLFNQRVHLMKQWGAVCSEWA
jgi:integrase